MARCLKCNAYMQHETPDGLCEKCEAMINQAMRRRAADDRSSRVNPNILAQIQDEALDITSNKDRNSSRLRRYPAQSSVAFVPARNEGRPAVSVRNETNSRGKPAASHEDDAGDLDRTINPFSNRRR